MTHSISRVTAGIALAIAISLETFHTFVLQQAWSGFSLAFNATSYFFIPLWILAIADLWTNGAMSKIAVALGILLCAMQGVDVALSGVQLGQALAYFLCAVIALTCSALEYVHYEAKVPREFVTALPSSNKRVA